MPESFRLKLISYKIPYRQPETVLSAGRIDWGRLHDLCWVTALTAPPPKEKERECVCEREREKEREGERKRERERKRGREGERD